MPAENIKKAREAVKEMNELIRDKFADLVEAVSNIEPEDILDYIKERDGSLPEGPFEQGADPLENAKAWISDSDKTVDSSYTKWNEFNEILEVIKDDLNEGIEIFPNF